MLDVSKNKTHKTLPMLVQNGVQNVVPNYSKGEITNALQNATKHTGV